MFVNFFDLMKTNDKALLWDKIKNVLDFAGGQKSILRN